MFFAFKVEMGLALQNSGSLKAPSIKQYSEARVGKKRKEKKRA